MGDTAVSLQPLSAIDNLFEVYVVPKSETQVNSNDGQVEHPNNWEEDGNSVDGIESNAHSKRERLDWLAQNMKFFFGCFKMRWEEITEAFSPRDIYQILKDNGYPKGVAFQWPDPRTKRMGTKPFHEYIECVKDWLEHLVTSERYFPAEEDQEYPDLFEEMFLKRFCKRLFRLFALSMHNELFVHEYFRGQDMSLEELEEIGDPFSREFCHFALFCWTWDAVSLNDWIFLGEGLLPLYSRFIQDRVKTTNRINTKQKAGLGDDRDEGRFPSSSFRPQDRKKAEKELRRLSRKVKMYATGRDESRDKFRM